MMFVRSDREREMSLTSSTAYLARRAAQKERVRILYRRALKDTLNWAVHRHLFYDDASNLRDRFEKNKEVEDVDTIDRLIADGEASYNKWRHPDPYIGKHEQTIIHSFIHLFIHSFIRSFVRSLVPWAPGGSKFNRNPTPPQGVEVAHADDIEEM
ncbi:hypothetical protein Lal_00002186 [Lupinus albus]|nr:hypothetical protein Lal_00002186 [Lupinus albus]